MRLETVTAARVWKPSLIWCILPLGEERSTKSYKIARTIANCVSCIFVDRLPDAEMPQNKRSGLSTPGSDRWPCFLRPHILRRRRDFPGPRILQSFDFNVGQRTPLAGRQEFIIQKSDADSLQLGNRMPNSVKHAADLLIAALMQSNFKPAVGFGRSQLANFRRGSALPFGDRNTAPQSLHGVVSRHPFDFHFVDLRDLIPGGGYDVGEVAVVGEQQQTLGIEIKPPHRMQPAQRRWNQLSYQRPALRISHAGQIASGLIQQDVDIFVLLKQRIDYTSLYLDLINSGISLGAQFRDDLPIDVYLARGYQFFCMTPRSDAGRGD